MSPTLKFGLTLVLNAGILSLLMLLIWHPVPMADAVKSTIDGILGQLVAIDVFVFHSLFRDSPGDKA